MCSGSKTLHTKRQIQKQSLTKINCLIMGQAALKRKLVNSQPNPSNIDEKEYFCTFNHMAVFKKTLIPTRYWKVNAILFPVQGIPNIFNVKGFKKIKENMFMLHNSCGFRESARIFTGKWLSWQTFWNSIAQQDLSSEPAWLVESCTDILFIFIQKCKVSCLIFKTNKHVSQKRSCI